MQSNPFPFPCRQTRGTGWWPFDGLSPSATLFVLAWPIVTHLMIERIRNQRSGKWGSMCLIICGENLCSTNTHSHTHKHLPMHHAVLLLLIITFFIFTNLPALFRWLCTGTRILIEIKMTTERQQKITSDMWVSRTRDRRKIIRQCVFRQVVHLMEQTLHFVIGTGHLSSSRDLLN